MHRLDEYRQLMDSCRNRTMIRNPYMGQCVSRTGAIGAPLNGMLASLGNGTWQKAYVARASGCAPRAFNIATGRCVKQGDKRGVSRAILAFQDEYRAFPGAGTPAVNNGLVRQQLANARRQLQNRNTRNVARSVTSNIFKRVEAANRADERRRFKNAGNDALQQMWTASAMAGALQSNANQAMAELNAAQMQLLQKHSNLAARNAELSKMRSVIAQKDMLIQDLILQLDRAVQQQQQQQAPPRRANAPLPPPPRAPVRASARLAKKRGALMP